MWTYIHPGCVVYHWHVVARTIANKPDCSKLVPVSESMRSTSIDEHLRPAKCQVSRDRPNDAETARSRSAAALRQQLSQVSVNKCFSPSKENNL